MAESEFGWSKPPSFGKSLIMFGLHGGAEWMGAALDSVNQDLYIPTISTPYIFQMYMISTESKILASKNKDALKMYNEKCASCHGKTRNGQYKVINDIV